MKKHLLTSLSVLALSMAIAGFAAPASATIVTITVSGIASVSNGDGALFGLSSDDLKNGVPYFSQYAFDTTVGQTYSSSTSNSARGGYYSSNPASPSLGASITINEKTSFLTGTFYGYIAADQSFAEARAMDSLSVDLWDEVIGTGPSSITTAFSISSDTNTAGFFRVGSDQFNLHPLIYTETVGDPVVSAAVPEPASMAILGVGLFGTGVMARRRRAALTATAG